MFTFGRENLLTLTHFNAIIYGKTRVSLSKTAENRLNATRHFIGHLLAQNIKVYGLTTGFADLREHAIDPKSAAKLSIDMIQSHDAGIGGNLPYDVVLGAMLVRANSLAMGYSGFQSESLKTLIAMINARIIPEIPSYGSLGASGDLAFLARLGRAMQGDTVNVYYKGQLKSAKAALREAKISPFKPQAKEGLALTNGTSFMASMMAIAYERQLKAFKNTLAGMCLFLNSVHAIDTAFNSCIQKVRGQSGQSCMAKLLMKFLKNSPFTDHEGVQNDYSIRCLPQILGPKFEMIMEQGPKIEAELNAVTDNPLIFCNDEISNDVSKNKIFTFNNERWAVLSGGNFHGETTASSADTLRLVNAKLALTLERQITYMLNPVRNKNRLPIYLICKTKDFGTHSGYMIAQYTANALAQKIAELALPLAMFNITSANESEDIVSYGASSAQKLLEQLSLLHDLNTIYLTVAAQAYGIAKSNLKKLPKKPFMAEIIFEKVQKEMDDRPFPYLEDENFEERYQKIGALLLKPSFCELIDLNPV